MKLLLLPFLCLFAGHLKLEVECKSILDDLEKELLQQLLEERSSSPVVYVPHIEALLKESGGFPERLVIISGKDFTAVPSDMDSAKVLQLKEGEGSAIVDLLKNPEKCSTIHDKLTDRDFFTVGGKRYRCDAHSRTNDMFIGYPQDSDNILFIQELYGPYGSYYLVAQCANDVQRCEEGLYFMLFEIEMEIHEYDERLHQGK